jgi:succinate-semialdehyde dehydrogenase/glutarate-semialdehyde dehydrogenase
MPIGTIYSILPFNHPFALSFHQALPQLLLGNCVISKHSATTPGVSVLVEKLMARSGF